MHTEAATRKDDEEVKDLSKVKREVLPKDIGYAGSSVVGGSFNPPDITSDSITHKDPKHAQRALNHNSYAPTGVNGQSMPHNAVPVGAKYFGSKLITKAADAPFQDNNECIALHKATSTGNAGVSTRITDFGPSVTSLDKDGRIPRGLAEPNSSRYQRTFPYDGELIGSGTDSGDLYQQVAMAATIDTRTCGEEANEWKVETKKDVSLVSTMEHAFKSQLGSGSQAGDNKSLRPNTKISTLSNDSAIEILSYSTENKPLPGDGDDDGHEDLNSYGSEGMGEDELEDGNEDRYGGNGRGGSSGRNQVGDELEDGDDEMETSSDSNSSSPEISSSRTDTGDVRNHGKKGEDKSKRNTQRELSTSQTSTRISKSGSQYDDETPDRPQKRRKKDKEGQHISPDQSKKPFACPYYKKNPLKHSDCAEWRSIKLELVKKHCKLHLGLWCPRCKMFQASTQSKINEHLEGDDCRKPEVYDSSDEKKANVKAEDIGKARTWQKIYEVLFPLYIPNPFWQSDIEFLYDIGNEEPSYNYRHRAIISTNQKQEYQQGLVEFLTDRLELRGGPVGELLVEYDNNWALKTHSQITLDDIEDSGIEPHDYDTALRSPPTKSFRNDQPNILKLTSDHKTPHHYDQLPSSHTICRDARDNPSKTAYEFQVADVETSIWPTGPMLLGWGSQFDYGQGSYPGDSLMEDYPMQSDIGLARHFKVMFGDQGTEEDLQP